MNTILILSLVAMVLGVALIFWGRSRSRLLGDIQGLETSTVDGLMEGRYVELKGRADCENPVKEPSGGRPCVYYRYNIEEKRRRRNSRGVTTTPGRRWTLATHRRRLNSPTKLARWR